MHYILFIPFPLFPVYPISYHWLVGSTPLKNMKVSWVYYSQYMEKLKMKFQTTNQIINVLYPIHYGK
jgi:hypothetical protein